MPREDTQKLMRGLIDTLSDSILKTLKQSIKEEVGCEASSDFLFAILLAAAAKARGWDKIPAEGV
jgi:hypothetical protein